VWRLGRQLAGLKRRHFPAVARKELNMATRRILLVYYSRTGTTRRIADEISAMLGCDVEALVDTKKRQGIAGYLRSGFDAGFRRLTTLNPTKYDPANYDLVIVGTPVWNASVSAPVRTYLTLQRGRLKHVAFFCTFGGSGSRRTFRQMSEICGIEPTEALDLRDGEIARGAHTPRVRAFVAGVTGSRAAA
jgi:flavodoxin